jgi:hypothetical protein
MKYRSKRKQARQVERQATHEEEVFVDLVTGHASARFTWVDVREDRERQQLPVRGTDVTVTIERLVAGEPLPSRSGPELVVFGSDDGETRKAAKILRRRGYEVLPAPDGYEGLERNGLV